MQCLPFHLLILRVIEEITDQGMTDKFHMDTDLMGSPGLKMKRDQGEPIFVVQSFKMGDGMFSLGKIYAAGDDRIPLSCNGSIDEIGRASCRERV